MRVEQLFEEKLIGDNYVAIGDRVISEGFLTESVIDETIKPFFANAFSKKVDNVSKYKSQYNSAIAKAKSNAKADGVDTAAVEKVVKAKVKESNPTKLNPSIIATQLKEIMEELKQQNKFKVVTYSLVMVTALFLLNSTMITILSAVVSPMVATMIVVIFFAPVVEEIGKYISIRTEATGAFLISFNIAEYLSYMLQASALGISLGAMAVLRLIPVAMHTMWTVIMRHKYQTEGGGPASTTVLHMLYNAFPIVGLPATFAYYQYLTDKQTLNKNKGVLEA